MRAAFRTFSIISIFCSTGLFCGQTYGDEPICQSGGGQVVRMRSFNSVDEASLAGFRKIGLNGFPLPEPKPTDQPRSDSADEQTYIDAFSENVVHQVTDIYIPFEGTSLSLQIRRNAMPEVWHDFNSVPLPSRPDRVFGPCWSSNVSAGVEVIEPIYPDHMGATLIPKPTYATVTDEDGSTYRFMCMPFYPGGAAWRQLPDWGSGQPLGTVSLAGSAGSGFELAKIGGTTVSYGSTGGVYTIYDSVAPHLPKERHYWSTIGSVTNRMGETMTFNAPVGSTGVSSISFRGKSVLFDCSSGVVTSITDPKGNVTTFDYSSGYLTAVHRPDGKVTTYTYGAGSELDNTPQAPSTISAPVGYYHYLNLASISKGEGRTYTFDYTSDHSHWNYMDQDYYRGYYFDNSSPYLLERVTLPDGSTVSLSNLGTIHAGYNASVASVSGSHELLIQDAGGTNWDYLFDSPSVYSENLLAPYIFLSPPYESDIPFHVSYNSLHISGPLNVDMSFSNGLLDHFSGQGSSLSFQYGGIASAVVTTEIDSLGYHTDLTYGVYDSLASLTDPEGRRTEYDLDSLGRHLAMRVKDSAGHVVETTEYEYGNTATPGVVTKETVKRSTSDPAWATDLVTRYVVDSVNGNILQKIVGLPGHERTTTYVYDLNNNKTSETDPLGHVTTFTYDTFNRLVEVHPPGTGTIATFYDTYGNKIRVDDENGHSTLWQYDALDRVIAEGKDLNGNHTLDTTGDIVTRYTYNHLNSKLTQTSPRGDVTTMEYDALQRLTKSTDPLGKITLFEYGTNSGCYQFYAGYKPTKVTDARGFKTLTTYDANYRPTQTQAEYQTGVYATTTQEYDHVGNVTKQTDPLSTTAIPRVTTKTYDALNRETATTWPDLTGTQTFYTATGLKFKTVDELGADTLVEYDDAGRPVKTSSPEVDDGFGATARSVTQTSYDDAGNVTQTTNPLGRVWSYTYDNRNRKLTETRPGTGTPTLHWTYDAVGNVTETTDALGHATDITYDAASRPTQEQAPSVSLSGGGTGRPTTLKEYDANGNITKLTDPNGHETVNTYDALNRLLTTTDAESIVVQNEYDAVGNRTAVVDGKGNRTEFAYDGLKRNTTVTDAATKSTTFEYNAVDKTARVDALTHRTEYTYDLKHRLTAINYIGRSDDNRLYTYDATGNLLTVTEPATAKAGKADVAYSYDALKRQLTETSGGLTHTYKYDLAGNRISVLYGGLSVPLISAYDEQNRLTTLTQGTLVTSYTYDLNGNNLIKTLPNGDTDTSVYDALNRTVSLTGVSGASSPLYAYAYEYDAASNVKKVTETYPTTTMNRVVANTYDGDNRLTEEAVTGSGALTTSYTYDAANNRLSMTKGGTTTTYQYNNLNQLKYTFQGFDIYSYGYDANGNRTDKGVYPGSNRDQLEYDYENRLVTAQLTGPSVGLHFTFGYDYRTRRIARTATAGTDPWTPPPAPPAAVPYIAAEDTRIIFSGGTSVREINNATSLPTVDYVRGSDWGGGVGGILYSVRAGVPSFTHYNRRGDVTAKTNAAGAITYQAEYEAFGKRTVETGATADRQKSNTKDEDIPGYANEGFRFRDLETGTFLTRDPAGFVDGPNLYTYVVDNPWTHFDPEGLKYAEMYGAAGATGGAAAVGIASIAVDVGTGGLNILATPLELAAGGTVGGAVGYGLGTIADVLTGNGGAASQTSNPGGDSASTVNNRSQEQTAIPDSTGGPAPASIVPDSTGSPAEIQAPLDLTTPIQGPMVPASTGAPADPQKPIDLTTPIQDSVGVDTLNSQGQTGSIYVVPGEATPSGKPYVGRHNKPDPAKTRRSNDGRDRTKAQVVNTYNPANPQEGKQKEQGKMDELGGLKKLDNKRNEIKKPSKKK